jgi:arsenate reductase-like glutaredoxin family protein
VDNTFNFIDWTTIKQQEISKWKENMGDSRLSKWYNQKAKSKNELNKIKNHLVSNKSMLRIENKLVLYLDGEINER